jgi:hypothetical protein
MYLSTMHNQQYLIGNRQKVSDEEFEELELYEYEIEMVQVENLEHLYKRLVQAWLSSLPSDESLNILTGNLSQ